MRVLIKAGNEEGSTMTGTVEQRMEDLCVEASAAMYNVVAM